MIRWAHFVGAQYNVRSMITFHWSGIQVGSKSEKPDNKYMFSISSGNCFVFSQSEFLISKGSFMEILTELEQLEVYACHIMPTGLYPSSRLTMLQTLAFYRCRHTCNGTAISDTFATWLLLPVVGISAICCHMLDDDQLGADSRCTVKECGCSRRNWLIFKPQTYCIYEREFPFECSLRRGGGGGGGGGWGVAPHLDW